MSTKKIQILDSLIPPYDETLSETSTNAVQNKAVASAVSDLNTRIDKSNESVGSITVDSIGAAKSNHNHDDRYYTGNIVDTKISTINTSITNIVNGTTKVAKATSADSATSATSADSATKATQDGNGKVIFSTYETKTDASSKLTEAKTYTDTVASGKSDITHNHDEDYDALGAANTALASAKSYTDTKTSGLASTSSVNTSIGTHNTSTSTHSDIRALISDLTTKLNNFLDVDDTTTDQLSEVLTLINNNKGTLESLTTSKINVSDIVNNLTTNSTSKVLSAAQGVAIKTLIDALQAELDSHTHSISDVSGLQAALDGKAATSHGTHVTYSTTAPVMDGTASVGSASTVARSDHRHPTDTSRAAQTDLDALETVVAGKANASHSHSISDVTNLQSSLDAKANSADIAKTVSQGISNSSTAYYKIFDFGAWGTGAWYQKGFSMLLTSRAGELVWVSLAANDSNTTAKAFRLINTYSKIKAIYYSASESAVYCKMVAWSNNLCAHILTNINGDYVPTVAQASALPDDAVEINIVEFGVSSNGTQVGDTSVNLLLGGAAVRPTYNGSDVALKSDVEAVTLDTLGGNDRYYTETEVDTKVATLNTAISGKAASSHTHDDRYYTETEVDAKLAAKLSLSGGTMTGAVKFNEVDGNCINFDNGIYINKRGGSTLLGGDGSTAWVGMPQAALTFRGSTNRPTYNGNDMALKSDVDNLQSQLDELIASAISVYAGTEAPSDDFGEDGDLYLISG